MARRTRSGTLVGPGIWRKCRPLRCFITCSLERPSEWRQSPGVTRGWIRPKRNCRLACAPGRLHPQIMSLAAGKKGDPAIAARLRKELRGEVLFDAFSRGRYSTDASIYQIEPVGIVVPRDRD